MECSHSRPLQLQSPGPQVLLFLFCMVSATLLHAQEATKGRSLLPMPEKSTITQQRPHVGLRAGMASPQDNYDGAFEYGVEVGYQPYIPFGAALELSSFSSANGPDGNLYRTKLLAKGTYNFGGTVPVLRDSFAGAMAGPVLDRVSNNSKLRMGVGLQTGFDVPLTRSGRTSQGTYSIGANANYLFVSNSAPDVFGLTGLVKYWY